MAHVGMATAATQNAMLKVSHVFVSTSAASAARQTATSRPTTVATVMSEPASRASNVQMTAMSTWAAMSAMLRSFPCRVRVAVSIIGHTAAAATRIVTFVTTASRNW